MPVQDPSQAHRVWSDTFNRGDIEPLLALYAPDAILVAQPGQQISGTPGIRAAMEGFLAAKGTITIRDAQRRGGRGHRPDAWKMDPARNGPDGQPLEMNGDNAEVWQRQTGRDLVDHR